MQSVDPRTLGEELRELLGRGLGRERGVDSDLTWPEDLVWELLWGLEQRIEPLRV